MKRTLILPLVLLALCGLLAGCGNSEPAASTTPAVAPGATTQSGAAPVPPAFRGDARSEVPPPNMPRGGAPAPR